MKRIQMIQTHPPRIAAPALVVLLAACAPQPQATPAATPAAAAFTTSEAQPSAADERLLINTEQGLWMGRPDGSLSAMLVSGRVIVRGPLSGAISPSGGLIAYLTASDPAGGQFSPSHLTLNVLSPSGRGPSAAIPLTSPETKLQEDLPEDIQNAILGQPSFAWSPEGERLAFIGAGQGPSADLYEYWPESGEVVRLTENPDQDYRPLWSPDGAWIVHATAGPYGGNGNGVTGFYAARADGAGAITLYEITRYSADELVDGWLDGHTLVAHSQRHPCGPSDLRLVDLAAQKADLVFDGCLGAAAAGGGSVLFAQSLDAAGFDENPRPGVYILTVSDRTPRLLSGDNVQYLAWAEGIGAFLAKTWDNRLLEISPSGGIRELPLDGTCLPTVAPGGRYWAYSFSVPGVFVGGYGTEPAKIFDGQAAWNGMLFSPAGDALYFITESDELYRAQAPEWTPVLLATGIKPASDEMSMAWLVE
jgi:hypothetical protein